MISRSSLHPASTQKGSSANYTKTCCSRKGRSGGLPTYPAVRPCFFCFKSCRISAARPMSRRPGGCSTPVPMPKTINSKSMHRHERSRRRWWVYQANDLLHYSYETLLKYTLDTLEDYPTGIALNTLVAELVSALSEADHDWPPTWRDFLADQRPAQNANGDSLNSERSLVEAIAPTSGLNHRTTPEAAWAALRLLAVVVNRAQAESAIIGAAFGHLDREGFHSLVTEMNFLNAGQDQPFPFTVARIIEERIIKRHLWVAHRKFRYQNDYTFLIEADDGRVRLRAGNGPVLTNPRLGPAITFLEDIHLIDAHGVSARGKSLLEAL
jgi:hypothetical protein